MARRGDDADAPIAEQVDGLRKDAERLAILVEVEKSHPRLRWQMVAHIPLGGREPFSSGRPLFTRAGELSLGQQSHAARVVDMKVGHDHLPHGVRDDAQRAQLLVERLLRGPQGSKRRTHQNSKVSTERLACVGMHTGVDQDRPAEG